MSKTYAKENGIVTKIYELRTLGYSQVHEELQSLVKDFQAIKKAKQDLGSIKSKVEDPAALAEINKKIQETSLREAELTLKIKEKVLARKAEILQEKELAEARRNGTESSIGAYVKLIKAYQAAKAEAQDMAAEFGVESEQALAAAKSIQVYREQILATNKLIRNGGNSTNTVITPTSDNSSALQKEQEDLKKTGTVVTELDQKEAQLTNTATAMGESHITATQQISEGANSISEIKLAFDQYTGSIRDNIRVQLENSTQLDLNRNEQKKIQSAIKETGNATTAQISRLAALKEEEVLLSETNKNLAITIRNQAKEFISAGGSIDELQAQVNLLQQSYEQLSAAEQEQPFGKELKAQIDILEPKVKALEATLGKFGRNVGNYPKPFTEALKVLEKEIDAVQGKLVKGNFKGAELDNLTAKQNALKKATSLVNKEFETGAQVSKAYTAAAQEIGLAYGTDSEVFKNFSVNVGQGNRQLNETNDIIKKNTASGSKLGGVFSNIWAQVRQLANEIPGLGIQGVVLLLLLPLESLASKLFEVVTKAKDSGSELDKLNKRVQETQRVFLESEDAFVNASTAIEKLKINIQLAKEGVIDKEKVLNDYNETVGKTIGQVDSLDKAEKSLIDRGPAYVEMMLLKAAANLALEQAQKKVFEAEQLRQKKSLEFQSIATNATTFSNAGGAGTAPGFVPSLSDPTSGIADRQKAAEKAKKQAIKETEDAKKTLQEIAAKLFNDAKEVAKKAKIKFEEEDEKNKPGISRLTNDQQNAIKEIEAIRALRLAEELKQFEELKRDNKITQDEEIKHQAKLLTINQDAIDKKLQIVKNKTSEEKKVFAELQLERVKGENETGDKIQAIRESYFKKEEERLLLKLQADRAAIESRLKLITEDPTISETLKLQAKIDSDKALLNLELKYQADIDAIEKQTGKTSVKNAKAAADEIRKIQEQLRTDQAGGAFATLKDIQAVGQKMQAEFQSNIADQRLKIENSDLSRRKKDRALAILDLEEKKGLLAREVAALQSSASAYKRLYDEKRITQTEYSKFNTELANKEAALAKLLDDNGEKSLKQITDIKSGLKAALQDILSINPGSQEDLLLERVLTEGYSLAQSAMSSYFNSEEKRLRESLSLQQERIDIERDQVKARAQSQAEIESIDKQYAAKKKAAERKAGEELKKLKKAEAKIALVTELANIAVAAASNPANGVTFGASGAIMYGLLSAIAIGRYGVRLGEINRTQFEYGGQPGNVPLRGGEFGGKPHSQGGTPFVFRGNQYEAEVKELSIIRTKDAPQNKRFTVSGTQREIASAINRIGGGRDFAPGAKISRFAMGGYLGEFLQAPVFIPSQGNGSSEMAFTGTKEIVEEIRNLANDSKALAEEQSKRIDRLEVVQVTSSVTSAQKKETKQNSIGIL